MAPPSELAPAAMGELVDSIADYNNSAIAIGFSVYYYIDQMYSKPGLRLLAVDGVTPGNDTLADGSYPLCNDFTPSSTRMPPRTARIASCTIGWIPPMASPASRRPGTFRHSLPPRQIDFP